MGELPRLGYDGWSWEYVTPGLKSSLILTFALIVITMIIGIRVKKLKTTDVPTGVLLVSVVFVEMVNNMTSDFFKKYWKQFTPYMLTILLFLAVANTASLLGLTAPLSNINVALGFSLLAFGSIQVSALFIKKPKQRMKDLLEPNPLFLPINLVGEISTPFAMGLRLFGNLLSGSIIGIIVYGLTSWLGILFGAFLLHPIFDVFFGVIQAYVFFMLFSIFTSMAIED
jgi:F-type H+-transporting ATPase subunit a